MKRVAVLTAEETFFPRPGESVGGLSVYSKTFGPGDVVAVHYYEQIGGHTPVVPLRADHLWASYSVVGQSLRFLGPLELLAMALDTDLPL